MPEKLISVENIQGLSVQQIPALRKKFGSNIFHASHSRHLLHIIWDIAREPMLILLLISCSLYFILGEISEGIMMLAAIAFVAAISLYQEVKSTNAVKALKRFTEPMVTVIRDGSKTIISAEEIVPGDILLLSEGMNIPADAIILQMNDLSINESIITGESFPVEKNESENNNQLYQGTTVNSGQCIARVTTTGNNTLIGKLGKSVDAYQLPKTLLQLQINKFIRIFALFGIAAFLIIFFINYSHNQEVVTSLLFALTLAMSILPEEIPVAFSSFMALGAYKMSRIGIIARQPQIIENLGAVSVICFDKTGTITENKMQLKTIYDHKRDILIDLNDRNILYTGNVIRYAALASECNPFDEMEKAIWDAYQSYTNTSENKFSKMIFEYPLEGRPPMMTHVYENNNEKVAAAKGAAERIVHICKLNKADIDKITAHTKLLASKGYRVLGVASCINIPDILPQKQEDFNWRFDGLVALYDPPKKNMATIFKKIYNAKIGIKLITGDYPETAINIAEQTGIINPHKYYTGDKVMEMTEDELNAAVKTTNVFARMFPEAKLKVVEALKYNDEIIAMTGDGVNDGPALKSASIGIAMGKKGTEIATQAADLIITDDNIEHLIAALRDGRKIFNNFKKAIRYIISIHVPIILTASLPLILGWKYPNIFSPIHIIFMELIMGPTCSLFFEKEPAEKNIMSQPPRKRAKHIFNPNELLISIMQGIVIAVGILILYYYLMASGATLAKIRTMVFVTLLLSNFFLTFSNRSFTKPIYYTIYIRNNLAYIILIITPIFLTGLLLIPFVRDLFQFIPITMKEFGSCLIMAFVSVIWIEAFKIMRKPS